MPYEGPGLYEHYKGGRYEVFDLALCEATVVKPGQPEHEGAGPEIVMVPYEPLSPGSLLESRWQEVRNGSTAPVKLWLRELGDFERDVQVSENLDPPRPRFERLKCVTCESKDDIHHVGGGRVACARCGNNW